LVTWDRIQRPFALGGLGIHDLKSWGMLCGYDGFGFSVLTLASLGLPW
jgi:hypothetical protein